MSQDQDPFFVFERDILAPNRSPVLEEVKPQYGPRASPAPLVPVDELSSESSDVENTEAARPQEKPGTRKGRDNRTFADRVLILSLDPNQRALAGEALLKPLDSSTQSEADEEEEARRQENEDDGGGDHDDNEARAAPRQMRRPRRVIQNGANQTSTKTKPVARTVSHTNPNVLDDDDDFPMIDSPATVADEHPVQSPPRSAHAVHKPEPIQAFHAPHALSKKTDLVRKQFNTIPPPKTRPLFPNLRLNPVPRIHDGDQVDDSILKSPILGKYAISPRDAHPDFTLPAMQQRSPPRPSPAGLPDYRTTLPPLKIAIGDPHDPSLGGFACMSPSIGRPSPAQFGSYASPASYSAYSAMSPPDPPSQGNGRTTTRDSNTSVYSDCTSSTCVSVSTPASSIITPSPAASGPSSLTALPEQDQEEDGGEDSRMQQVPPKEIDLRSRAEVRSKPQPQPEARSKTRPQPAARLKLHLQRAGRSKPRPQPAARSKAIPQPDSEPQHQPESHTEAESETRSGSDSELSELSERTSELELGPEFESQSKPQSKRPSMSQSKSQSDAPSNAAAMARFSLGPFKCTYAGCNAAPFQTQYLLNSHMNVHSNTRTHFCPVKDCPRGYGGLGFKRKNEMVRHGLVHTSPGYICPFCPDQQHKYPRPDNLQRHVRQHHSAEDRHDPRLREVLNQRTDGNNKAGKRRMRLF